MVSSENLYRILATWKCVYLSVMRPSNYRYLLCVRSSGSLKMRFFKGNETLGWRTYSNFSFWPPKKAILALSLNPPLEATGFMSTNSGHFGNIKMWFFRSHDSLGSWYLSFVALLFAFWRPGNVIPQVSWHARHKVLWLPVSHIGHFDAPKIPFWQVQRPWAQGYIALSENLLSNYSSFMRPTTYLASTKPLYGLLEAWKWDCLWFKNSWLPLANFCFFGSDTKRFLPWRKMSTTTRHFGKIKIWFFKGHECLGSRISCFRSGTLPRFKSIKIWFL